MIRIYSANFTAKDMREISRILLEGLKTVAPVDCYCIHCEDCEHNRVCTAVSKAIMYCDKKALEMVEH